MISVTGSVALVTGKDVTRAAQDVGLARGRYPEAAQHLGLFDVF